MTDQKQTVKLVIISGLSGSGKTTALHVLEDIGFYCVDNLPVSLLPLLTRQLTNEAQPAIQKIAAGIDARNNPKQLDQFSHALTELKKQNIEINIVFIDAEDRTLIRRFSETRRKHPGTSNKIALSEAIINERQLLEPISKRADLQLDTSKLTLHDLRDIIKQRIDTEKEGMSLLFKSFGFKNGIPADADMVFDARCLPNPHWIHDLRQHSGRHQDVIDFLQKHDSVENMLQDIIQFLDKWLPGFVANNRSYMTVAIGCTGGYHRSVYLTEKLHAHFKTLYANAHARHRDLQDH